VTIQTKSTGLVADNRSADDVHSGQVRMAYRLAARYRNKLLHVHGLGWHYWDETRWTPDDAGAAHRAVLDVLRHALTDSLGDKDLTRDIRKCESASGVNGTLTIASNLPEFAARVDDLDADPYLLNVANGTLDLRTLELRAHHPADRITKVTAAAYDPAAPSPTWKAFVERVLPDAGVREYLRRVVGMALLGRVTEHLLPILTGTGRNGKGVFYKSALWALGDYGLVAEPELFLARDYSHPTGQLDLMGRRLVVVSESDHDARLDEAKMKRLTGGDPITARKMRQDNITFEPSHQALMITNHLPTVRGDDPATWARLRVVPFDVTIPESEQNKELDQLLRAEADAVLSWMVAGHRQYRELMQKLQEPEAVLRRTSAYRIDSDAIARFISECCLTDSSVIKALTGPLYEAWEKWRTAEGVAQISQKAFSKELDVKGFPVSQRDGQGRRWRTGIALLTTEV
jgi:putative DNA primase/helicase